MTRGRMLSLLLTLAALWAIAVWLRPDPTPTARRAEAASDAPFAATESATGIAAPPKLANAEAPETPEPRPVLLEAPQPITSVVAEHAAPTAQALLARTGGARDALTERFEEVSERFAREPRDPRWAPERERALRDAANADALDPKTFQIACRQTLCRVEFPALPSAGFALKGASGFLAQLRRQTAGGSVGEGEARRNVIFIDLDPDPSLP